MSEFRFSLPAIPSKDEVLRRNREERQKQKAEQLAKKQFCLFSSAPSSPATKLLEELKSADIPTDLPF